MWGCMQFRGYWWSTFAAVCLALNSNLNYVPVLDGDCVEYVIFCFKQNTAKTLRAQFKFRQNIELQTMLPSSIKKRKEKAMCFSNSCFSWLWPAWKGSKCDSIVTMTIVLVRLVYSKVKFVFGVDIGSAGIGKFSIVFFPESYKQASGVIV